VQGHTQRIRPDAFALGQKGVRAAEHSLTARSARGLGAKQVSNHHARNSPENKTA
jgi:hypothetical protein